MIRSLNLRNFKVRACLHQERNRACVLKALFLKDKKKKYFREKSRSFLHRFLCHFSGHFVCTQKYMGQKFVNFAKKESYFIIHVCDVISFSSVLFVFLSQVHLISRKKSNENVPQLK